MRILTLGDSWTYGSNEYGLDPAEISWPAQMAKKYNVEVVNLARGGSSNQRATRIGIEELCRDCNYDYVIFPLAPASRTEVLNYGKWWEAWAAQVDTSTPDEVSKFFRKIWHPWNDVQNTIMLAFYFMHSVKSLGIPFYVTGLSLMPSQYAKELSWINDYQNNNDFNSLGMPLAELNIGINDLDRKLKSLKAIHSKNLELQPEYFDDVIKSYFMDPLIEKKYQYNYKSFKGHPNDNGYSALTDYFAGKIGLI
jgi:hypothetical protein